MRLQYLPNEIKNPQTQVVFIISNFADKITRWERKLK